MTSGTDPRQHYGVAARALLDLVRQAPNSAWDGPGLGVWDLRALVGHAVRALLTVETYLGQAADREEVATAADYFAAASAVDHGQVAERGRMAGRELGEDPAAAVRVIVDRVLALVDGTEDRLLPTAVGAMRLETYLPTRTFELVVHGLDVARALGLPPPELPAALLEEVSALAATTAARRGHGVDVLLALTGRESLPPHFSMV